MPHFFITSDRQAPKVIGYETIKQLKWIIKCHHA